MAIARDHFWLGTGPGTFGSIYPKYKTAQTEEAQLVHNNFLEMWSDSGLPAFIVFAALWLLAIKDGFRLAGQRRGDVGAVAVCAALTGWVVHGLVDFDLYVPGVAIPAFLLLGISARSERTADCQTGRASRKGQMGGRFDLRGGRGHGSLDGGTSFGGQFSVRSGPRL